MDKIHDIIQQFNTDEDGIDKILAILEMLNNKINSVEASAARASQVASMLANGIKPD